MQQKKAIMQQTVQFFYTNLSLFFLQFSVQTATFFYTNLSLFFLLQFSVQTATFFCPQMFATITL